MTATTPFDDRILWVHWQGARVEEGSIGELAANIARDTPNVAGLLVKSSDGAHWQGRWDSKPALAVDGPASLGLWAQRLAAQGLQLHLWCVLQGAQPQAEAARVSEACQVAGVRSMLLDVEGGKAYFGGRSAADAREVISRIRAGIDPQFHLGLNFDARGDHPRRIHIEEWLPHVQSLHPMVYHHHFSVGQRSVQSWLDEIVTTCHRLAPGLPVVPMLGTYPVHDKAVPPQEIRAGIRHALAIASGVTLFRLGNLGAACSPAEMRQAVAAAGGRQAARGAAATARPTQQNPGSVAAGKRIGLNINAAEVDKGAVLAHCRESGAASYLVMNDCGFAQRLHDHLEGRSIIVARSDWPDDTTSIPVGDLLARWTERASHAPSVYHYFPNEPIPAADCPLPELLRRLVALMRACRERGVRACIGNFAAGTVIEEADVQAGMWDEFIREALAFTAGGGGYIGFHEYSFGVLPWGCGGRNPQDLISQPQRVADRKHWPTQAEILATPGANWHLLRSTLLAARAKALALPMFPVLVTEFGWDRMPNLELEGVIPWFDQRRGRTRGPLLQLPALSSHWFGPDCDPLALAMEQLQWAEATYPNYVKGMHLFTWSYNQRWREFNYAAWPGALAALAALPAGTPAPGGKVGEELPIAQPGCSAVLDALDGIEAQVTTIRQWFARQAAAASHDRPPAG